MQILNAYADDSALYLVSRGEDGRRRIETRAPEFSCFLRRADTKPELLAQLRPSKRVKRIVEEGDCLRVVWRDRWSRHEACKPKGLLEQEGVEVLEADVDPVRRFLTDHPDVQIARPRRCFVDFECDSRKTAEDARDEARMLAWSIVDEEPPGPRDATVDFDVPVYEGLPEDTWTIEAAIERVRGRRNRRQLVRTDRKRVRVVSSAVLVEDSDTAEQELIEAFWRAIEPYDQVVAWAGDFFDFPYLAARTLHAHVRVDERRWLWLDQLPWYRVRDTDADGAEKQSRKLDDVARLKVGVGKLEGVSGKDSWYTWLADPEALLRYCERDAALCVLVERATGYLDILRDLAELSACFADSNGRRAHVGRNFYGVQPTSQVEGFLMRLGAARGHRFRSHWYDPDLKRRRADYAGGHVEDPSVGLHEGVHVCDFARLYPNAILTFNLSPETYRGKVPERPTYAAGQPPREIPEGCAVVPGTRAIFAQEPRGVLPLALERLLELRAECSKAKKVHAPDTREWSDADRKDQALKTAINAYYGVVGSPYSRFFLREVAESTTLTGQWLLAATMRAATEAGYSIKGGDTDSTFVSGPTEEQFRAFVAACNADLYPRMVREVGAARCTISLEFEKTFRRMLIAGKKRYGGLVTSYKGVRGTKLVVCGLEARRGDWPRLSARLQEEVLRLAVVDGVADVGVYVGLVERVREIVLPKSEIHAGKPRDCSEPLTIEEVSRWQQLAKPLDEYVQKKKDDGELDRYYLWEQLVYPPTQRVLEAACPAEDWAKYLKARPSRRYAPDPRQLKLF